MHKNEQARHINHPAKSFHLVLEVTFRNVIITLDRGLSSGLKNQNACNETGQHSENPSPKGAALFYTISLYPAPFCCLEENIQGSAKCSSKLSG